MAIIVKSGEVSSGVVLTADSMYVYSGGIANDTTISYGGAAVVSGGGVMNDVLVNSYGALVVTSTYNMGAGTATRIKENGGYVDIADSNASTFVANSFSGLVLSSGARATLHSGTTANLTTILSGWVGVYDGGFEEIN